MNLSDLQMDVPHWCFCKICNKQTIAIKELGPWKETVTLNVLCRHDGGLDTLIVIAPCIPPADVFDQIGTLRMEQAAALAKGTP